MKIIIAGSGKVGFTLAEQLVRESHDVTIVDLKEAALRRALDSGKVAGAGLDVVETEPIRGGNPLLGAKNCLITPHIAWATHEARARLLDTVFANIRAFIEKHPQNVVS